MTSEALCILREKDGHGCYVVVLGLSDILGTGYPFGSGPRYPSTRVSVSSAIHITSHRLIKLTQRLRYS